MSSGEPGTEGNRMACTRAQVFLATTALLSTVVHANPVYFVVGEATARPPHGDSYVLPLFAAADIAHARALVAQGRSAGAPIVIARIDVGADGINRNMLGASPAPWSWHITEFVTFADT